MSAISSTATTGRSNHVSPLGAAVALAGIVALAAVGLAISQGVGTTSTVAQPAAGPAVVTNGTMSGPHTAAQKGLSTEPAADFPDYFQRINVGSGSAPYGGSDFAAKYAAWLKLQKAAIAADFPDYFERINVSTAPSGRVVDGRISNQLRHAQ